MTGALERQLLQTSAGIGPAGMVDQYAGMRAFKQGQQCKELIVLHLDLGIQVQLGQTPYQGVDLLKALGTQQRSVERHTDYTMCLVLRERLVGDVVRHHDHTFMAPLVASQRVEQATVVIAISRDQLHDHGMANGECRRLA
ncbi:hypothetical protein D3C84_915800 [compost metagenome]